jgi:hypothetical protein
VRVRCCGSRVRGVVALFIAVSSHVCQLLEPLAVPAHTHSEAEAAALASLHVLPAFVFLSVAAQTAAQLSMEVRQDPRDIAAPVVAVTTIAALYYLSGYMQKLTLTAGPLYKLANPVRPIARKRLVSSTLEPMK